MLFTFDRLMHRCISNIRSLGGTTKVGTNALAGRGWSGSVVVGGVKDGVGWCRSGVGGTDEP